MYLHIAICALLACSVFGEHFSEELFIRKLPDDHIYAHFSFVVDRDSNETHFSLFPKSMADVFSQYSVDELHLSVTQGLWRHRRWGYPLRSEAPTGTELWAWFKPEVSNVDGQWKRLTSSLAGAFCTSLQFMDSKSTATPRFAFRMDGVSPAKQQRPMMHEKYFTRYAALPGETPCTNTLTPWTKLLPCHTKSGLGSLLEPHSVFTASYASVGMHFIHTCPTGVEQCTNPGKRITLSLALVFNPKTTNLENQVSLRRMFVRDIQSPCVLASKSKIIVDSNSFSQGTATPTPTSVHLSKFHEYDLTSPISFPLPFDLNIRYKKTNRTEEKKAGDYSAPITVHRYLAGYGEQSGTVVCQIDNHLGDHVPIIYTQTFPWFLYLYLHTLKIVATPPHDFQHNGIAVTPGKVHYTPSRLRESIALLELALMLPPYSRTTITLDVDYQLLRWTEYPPDAHHGFYINSGTITAVLPPEQHSGHGAVIDTLPREFSTLSDYLKYRSDNGNNVSTFTYLLKLYTESLIVYLPTPDFSMPYNALCLVCTVVAIGFGSVHSLTTKRFVLVDPQNPPTSMIAKVKLGILNLKSRVFGGASQTPPPPPPTTTAEAEKPEKQD